MKTEKTQYQKVSVLAQGGAWGLFLLALIFVVSIWCSFTGFGQKFLEVFNYLNPNPYQVVYSYNLSAFSNFVSNIMGILINSFYAFIDGLIMGSLLGFFHNLVLSLLEKISSESPELEEKEEVAEDDGSSESKEES